MPKVTNGANRKTPDQKRMENEIISYFGMSLTLAQVMKVIGKRRRDAAREWLKEEEIPAVLINGRRHWWASDVARALERSKIRAC